MEENLEKNNEEQAFLKGKVHFILSHSYVILLFAVILGVIFDIIFPISLFDGQNYNFVGLAMIFLGSVLVYWAQSTSRFVKKTKNERGVNFEHGPYKYLRSPTHLGLYIMTLGLAIIIKSPFSVIFIVVAYCITKFIFLKKEEKLLEKKYGETYLNYKSKTKNHI